MRLTTSDQVLKQSLDNEIILLDLNSGRYLGLQEVGFRAWVEGKAASGHGCSCGLLGDIAVRRLWGMRDVPVK